MEDLAREFESTIGSKLQRYLTLKSWWSTNYVSDWWEEYVYLRGRGPLMINSNFYGIDAIYMETSKVQAARAAHITSLLLIFRRTVERQELQPVREWMNPWLVDCFILWISGFVRRSWSKDSFRYVPGNMSEPSILFAFPAHRPIKLSTTGIRIISSCYTKAVITRSLFITRIDCWNLARYKCKSIGMRVRPDSRSVCALNSG